VAALSQVNRDPGGFLVSFLTPKVNVSNEKLTAVTLGLSFAQEIGRFGQLAFQGSWNNMLKHHFKQYETTPTLNLLTNPYWSTEFRNTANASITWNIARASTTLYANFRDKSPNYLATLAPEGYATPGASKLKSWTLFNLNFGYRISDAITVSATIDNLFDKMPPLDRSYSGLDYQPYNYLNYNIYGRSYVLEMGYRFGK
jgi:outer membrane receptor protein involved in Fe transport